MDDLTRLFRAIGAAACYSGKYVIVYDPDKSLWSCRPDKTHGGKLAGEMASLPSSTLEDAALSMARKMGEF